MRQTRPHSTMSWVRSQQAHVTGTSGPKPVTPEPPVTEIMDQNKIPTEPPPEANGASEESTPPEGETESEEVPETPAVSTTPATPASAPTTPKKSGGKSKKQTPTKT